MKLLNSIILRIDVSKQCYNMGMNGNKSGGLFENILQFYPQHMLQCSEMSNENGGVLQRQMIGLVNPLRIYQSARSGYTASR